jgi:DNA-binding protein HU-beta
MTLTEIREKVYTMFEEKGLVKVIKEEGKEDKVKPLTHEDAKEIVNFMDGLIEEAIEKDGFYRNSLGTLKKADRAARKGKNPRTKEEIEIPAYTTVVFKPSDAYKSKINAK